MDRLDVLEGDAEILAPAGKLPDGLGCGPGFVIVGGEEFEEGPCSVVAHVGDDCRTVGPLLGRTTS